jgi:hypothetical protein
MELSNLIIIIIINTIFCESSNKDKVHFLMSLFLHLNYSIIIIDFVIIYIRFRDIVLFF